MFKIIQPTSYTWPVTVELPVDGGRTEKATFDAEFKRLSQSRLEEIRGQIERSEIRDVDLVREVVVGWSGVTDGENPVPYSEAALDQLLDIPMVAASIVMALFQSMAGAKRKN
jgi:hypothetical protein